LFLQQDLHVTNYNPKINQETRITKSSELYKCKRTRYDQIDKKERKGGDKMIKKE